MSTKKISLPASRPVLKLGKSTPPKDEVVKSVTPPKDEVVKSVAPPKDEIVKPVTPPKDEVVKSSNLVSNANGDSFTSASTDVIEDVSNKSGLKPAVITPATVAPPAKAVSMVSAVAKSPASGTPAMDLVADTSRPGDTWSVSMRNYCCYINRTISWSNGLVRLKGDSGDGKTTVVRAVEWALYGTGDHDPNGTENAKTIVKLKCPFFEVERKSNPRALILSPLINGEIISVSEASATKRHPSMLYDDAAQSFVNKTFGPVNVWQGTISIDEDARHVLMSGSAYEKRTFIDSLVYRDDDPNTTIDEYRARVKTLKEKLRDVEGLMGALTDCVKEDHECPTMPTKSVADLNKELREHMDKIKHANSRIQLAGEYAKQQAEVNAIKSQIETLGELPATKNVISKIASMEADMTTRNKYAAQIAERAYLQTQLVGVDTSKILSVNVLKQRRRDVKEWKINSDLAASLEIDYTHEAVTSTITKLEREVKTLKTNAATRKEYLFLLDKVASMKKSLVELVSADEIDKLKSELASIDLGGDCDMNCPECNTPLKVVDKKLVKGAAVKYTVKELEAIKKKYTQLHAKVQSLEAKNVKRERDLAEIGRLEIKIGTYAVIPPDLDYEQEIADVQYAIKTCKTIKIITKVEDVSDEELKIAELVESLVKIKIPASIPDMPDSNVLTELKSRLSMCEMRDKLVKQVTTMIAKLSETIDVDELKADIANRETAITNIHNEITRWNVCSEHINCNKYWDLLDAQADLHDDIYITEMALSSCRSVQMTMMDKKILTLNNTITALLPEFLKHNEKITMSVAVKEAKIGKNVVPDVVLSIMLNGIPVKRVSKGQKERLGLCLSLASARLLGAKILVCDENFTKISEMKRDDCFKLIRKMLSNIPIIAMSHEDPDGLFDRIIPCDPSLWNVK